jgi:hypothetical protein
MTWADACDAMVSGKRVRLPHWHRRISIGFGEIPYLNATTLCDGCQSFAPGLKHMISKDWEIVEEESR